MRKIVILIALLFLVSGCSTLKLETDHDVAYDFTGKKTYTILHSDRVGDNTLANDRITQAIKNTLATKSFEEVSEKAADLLFVFHVNVQQMSDIRTDYQRVGYPGYRYGMYGYGYSAGTMVVATPSTYKWTEGKLIIDALNPQTKKIVWRGTATDEIDAHSASPQEKTQYINKVVIKVMNNFFKLQEDMR